MCVRAWGGYRRWRISQNTNGNVRKRRLSCWFPNGVGKKPGGIVRFVHLFLFVFFCSSPYYITSKPSDGHAYCLQQPIYETDGRLAIPLAGGSRSPSPSRREESSNAGRPPSANSCLSSTQHSYPNVHGPRSVSPHPFPNPLTPPSSYEQPIVRPRGPDDSNNRASSPRFRPLPIPGWTAGVDTGGKRKGPTELSGCQLSSESGSEEDELPVRPSAKALGKRRVIDDYEADGSRSFPPFPFRSLSDTDRFRIDQRRVRPGRPLQNTGRPPPTEQDGSFLGGRRRA